MIFIQFLHSAFIVQYHTAFETEAEIQIGDFKADIVDVNVMADNHRVLRSTENHEFTLQSIQENPPSNLDRIDQRQGLDNQYHYFELAGAKSTVYVIDSGVLTNVEELEGRATFAVDFTGTGYFDSTGHGTGIASIIAGRHSGVAKKSKIKSVKIIDGRNVGFYSNVLRALQFCVNDMQGKPAVAILSLLGPYNQIVNDAISAAVRQGLTVVVPAGNVGRDACQYTPSSAYGTVTVGAVNYNDQQESYSNFGQCVNIWAPGEAVISGTSGGYEYMYGTSVAAAHVAGVIALHQSEGIKDQLFSRATKGVLTLGQYSSPNLMVYSQ